MDDKSTSLLYSTELQKSPRDRLVYWLARLYRQRLTTTTGGNISCIDDDGTLYITPSGGDKAIVKPEHVCVCRTGVHHQHDQHDDRNSESDSFEGPMKPSMEWRLHTEIYKARPDCKAVLHAHSMALIAFSMAAHAKITNAGSSDEHLISRSSDENSISGSSYKNSISRSSSSSSDSTYVYYHNGVPDTRCLLSAWLNCGHVSFVPYHPPGSKELATQCASTLFAGECAILQNHGVVVIGSTLQEAYNRFITLEYLARSIVHATQLGVPLPLQEHVLDTKRRGRGATGNARASTQYLLPVPRIPRERTYGCCKRNISSTEKEIRYQLCKLIKRAYDQEIFTACSGSFSIRMEHEYPAAAESPMDRRSGTTSFLISPTGVDRSSVGIDQICYLADHTCSFNIEEKEEKSFSADDAPACYYHPTKIEPKEGVDIEPSVTAEIHDTIYRNHPEIHSIITAQPIYASAFCITGSDAGATKFDYSQIPESYLVLGEVQTLPFESLQDGGIDISRTLNPSPDNGAGGKRTTTIFIQGFGILSVGTSAAHPLKTFVQVEVCELMCGAWLMAHRRGGVVPLSGDQLKEIDVLFGNHAHC